MAAKGFSEVTWMPHLSIDKELGKWSDQGLKTVVDLSASFYALYGCMTLVNIQIYILYSKQKMKGDGCTGKSRVWGLKLL